MEERLPWLNESVRVPTPRFLPATYPEYLATVYTLWNVLDAIMHDHRQHMRPKFPYGYMREVQLHAYAQHVWQQPNVHTYCETGVNGGHGTAAMLSASPSLVSHSFDEVGQPYSEAVFKFLGSYFRERFVPYRGNSHMLLPKATHLRRSCDVILVDGDHSEQGTYQDIIDMQKLASCGATLLLDDMGGSRARLNSGPSVALERARDKGVVDVVQWHLYNRSSPENPCLRDKHGGRPMCIGEWGWAVARYKHCGKGKGAGAAE